MQDSADAANLKARLRSLRYRQRTMQPRKDKLREVLEHVEEYRTSTKAMTEEEYEVRCKPSAFGFARIVFDRRHMTQGADAAGVRGLQLATRMHAALRCALLAPMAAAIAHAGLTAMPCLRSITLRWGCSRPDVLITASCTSVIKLWTGVGACAAQRGR